MKFLSTMLGKEVRINKGGPHVKWGRLLDFSSNFIVLQSEEGVVYIHMEHVKSVTEMLGVHPDATEVKYGEAPQYNKLESMDQVMGSLVNQWVRLNEGPDKLEGALMESNADYVRMFAGKEMIFVPMFHIKSIMPIYKKVEENADNKDGQKEEQKNEKKNEKKK